MIKYLVIFLICCAQTIIEAKIDFPPFSDDMLIGGHAILVCRDPVDTTEWKFELMRHAQKTVEISGSYAGGEVLAKTLRILKRRMNACPELRVHFLIDHQPLITLEPDKKALQEVADAYPEQFFYFLQKPLITIQNGELYRTENHIKLLVVDEKYFVIGGTSLADNLSNDFAHDYEKPHGFLASFVPAAASDMDVVGSGHIAKPLRKEFFQLYALVTNEKDLDDEKGFFQAAHTDYVEVENPDETYVESLETHPDFYRNIKLKAFMSGPRRKMHTGGAVYYQLIPRAKHSIHLGQMMFFPVDEIYDQFIHAAHRGVSISLITNGTRSNSLKTTYFYAVMSRFRYAPLLLGRTFKFYQKSKAKNSPVKNVNVYEYKRENVLYHKKVMVVDKRYTVIGSYNLGKKSEWGDYELTLVIDSPPVAQKCIEILAQDLLESVEITPKQAVDWHFNLLTYVTQKFERTYIDGLKASVPFTDLTQEPEMKMDDLFRSPIYGSIENHPDFMFGIPEDEFDLPDFEPFPL